MRRSRRLLILGVILFVGLFAGIAAAEEEKDEGQEQDQSATSAEEIELLKKKVDDLEAKMKAQDQKNELSKRHIAAMPWEPERDYFAMPNGWFITTHGEFRTRAVMPANTTNGYTNKRGERIYAYDPHSTLNNDYGWWDSRVLSRTVVNFGDTAEIVLFLQFGDWAWGSRSAVFGGTGDDKFDHVVLQVRELWARYNLDPIPIIMEFGRMPWVLGNRLIQGTEMDGARGYYRNKYFEAGFGAARQYEGENYEMQEKYNDDEDTFIGWMRLTPTASHKLSAYWWYTQYDIPEMPAKMNPASPLHKIPGYQQQWYTTQGADGSNLGAAGANYLGNLGAGFDVNLEYDHQYGILKPTGQAKNMGRIRPENPEAIHFKGQAALARLNFHYIPSDTIALIGGYGSGDDPRTADYEGFFAPNNQFGMRDETAIENIRSGYFHVYEFLAPGAGVPGRMRDNLGTGGVENTTFANLAWDARFQANHHYYVSVGYIQASRENPDTNTNMIGIENDARVDYIFSNNVTFSLYGGHLFILGDYFRKHAHDAAYLVGEWKLSW